jgi:hypothetical protein
MALNCHGGGDKRLDGGSIADLDWELFPALQSAGVCGLSAREETRRFPGEPSRFGLGLTASTLVQVDPLNNQGTNVYAVWH